MEAVPEHERLVLDLDSLAELHSSTINFVRVDATNLGSHASSLGLEVGRWPAFAIQDLTAKKKYAFNGSEVTKEQISNFVQHYFEGTLRPLLKSESIPQRQEGPATIIVGDSFDQVVLDRSKDVLLYVFAPWCRACKR